MTARPPRARGLIDAQTAEVLALTHQGVFRMLADGSTSDVTPPFSWTCAAAGGGAVAIGGPEGLRWHGRDGAVMSTAVPSEAIAHLTVLAERVAAVSGTGRLTVWDGIGGSARSVIIDLECDGLVFDPDGSRVVVWGWDGAGGAAMTAIVLDGTEPMVFRPETGWPPADSGVAMLSDGILAVGGIDNVVLLSRQGRRIAELPLPGLERLTGSGSGVGWIRNRGADDIAVGLGLLNAATASLAEVIELPITSADPFPEFTVVRDSVLVAVGVGPRELAFRRLSAGGWHSTVTVELPDRPAHPAAASPVRD